MSMQERLALLMEVLEDGNTQFFCLQHGSPALLDPLIGLVQSFGGHQQPSSLICGRLQKLNHQSFRNTEQEL